MGWTYISIVVKMNMLKLWNRIIRISNTRLIKQIFIMDFNACKQNWTLEIKHLAEEIN